MSESAGNKPAPTPQRKRIIITRGKREPFTIIPNRIWEDTRLTWDAKAILGYLIGKPQDWKIRPADIAGKGPQSEYHARAALQLLRETGYVNMEKITGKHGRVTEWFWQAADAPVFGSNRPDVVIPDVVNRHLTKKEGTKNPPKQKRPAKKPRPPRQPRLPSPNPHEIRTGNKIIIPADFSRPYSKHEHCGPSCAACAKADAASEKS